MEIEGKKKRGRPKKLVASVSIAAVAPEVAAIRGPAILPPPPAQQPKSKRYARFETGWKSLRHFHLGQQLTVRRYFDRLHKKENKSNIMKDLLNGYLRSTRAAGIG